MQLYLTTELTDWQSCQKVRLRHALLPERPVEQGIDFELIKGQNPWLQGR